MLPWERGSECGLEEGGHRRTCWAVRTTGHGALASPPPPKAELHEQQGVFLRL